MKITKSELRKIIKEEIMKEFFKPFGLGVGQKKEPKNMDWRKVVKSAGKASDTVVALGDAQQAAEAAGEDEEFDKMVSELYPKEYKAHFSDSQRLGLN
tara:strand:- start:733 stop:1026 length:294 start_codon:yes stop_codon:yes gene_type:complete